MSASLLAFAGAAYALGLACGRGVPAGVSLIKGMAVLAMGLRKLTLPVDSRRHAARRIFRARHRFQVRRIDAKGVAAEVVEVCLFRYWPNQQLISIAMSTKMALSAVLSNAERSVGPFLRVFVSVRMRFLADPIPAPVERPLFDLRPEPSVVIANYSQGMGWTGVSIGKPPIVVHRAEVPFLGSAVAACDFTFVHVLSIPGRKL